MLFFFRQIVLDPFALQMRRQGPASSRTACLLGPRPAPEPDDRSSSLVVVFWRGFRTLEFLSRISATDRRSTARCGCRCLASSNWRNSRCVLSSWVVRSTSICFRIAGSCGRLLRSTGTTGIIKRTLFDDQAQNASEANVYAASALLR